MLNVVIAAPITVDAEVNPIAPLNSLEYPTRVAIVAIPVTFRFRAVCSS